MKRNVIILFVALLALSWYSAGSEAANKPKELKAHLDRAEELEAKEIYVDAAEEYEAALEYDPENAEIYVKRAQALLNSGDDREFISICEDTAENFQEDTQALDLLMEYYEKNGYEDRAVQYLRDFTENYPDNENAREWFLELQGSYTELYCRYEEYGEIVNDTMVVLDDELYGIADAEGSELIPAEYKELYPFSEDGFALARKTDGTWIYIDEDGQTRKVPDPEYKNPGTFSEERTPAEMDGKYGYLDGDMEPAGDFIWDELTAVKNGTGAGKTDGKWALVDENGEAKNDDRYDDIVTDEIGFCSAQERIFVKKDNFWMLVNTKGEEIGELVFEDAKAFTAEGCAAVCIDGKWGFIDDVGEMVIECTYDNAESFQNGYAAVCVGDKWGYIDEEGNIVIEPVFTKASHFSSEGTAVVEQMSQGEDVQRLIQLNLFK